MSINSDVFLTTSPNDRRDQFIGTSRRFRFRLLCWTVPTVRCYGNCSAMHGGPLATRGGLKNAVNNNNDIDINFG